MAVAEGGEDVTGADPKDVGRDGCGPQPPRAGLLWGNPANDNEDGDF